MRNAYITCQICNGKGRYPKRKRVGSQIVTLDVRCEYCNGTGEVLASKLKKHPMYDRWGNPIDERGRVVKNPGHEAWWRRRARKLDTGFVPRQVA